MTQRAIILLVIGVFLMAAGAAQVATQTGVARPDHPQLRLSNSRELKLSYTGAFEARQMLANNIARPASLAAADFDEDGVQDLACGYRTPNGGLVTLQRGNVDAIYPNAPEAQRRNAAGEFTDSPFVSPGGIFEIAEAPDFLFAGDFDADGHWDLVAGARGSAKLTFMQGDGHGGFAAPKRISLPGAITAMTGGEVNQPDGLTDLVVAVRAVSGPQLLVFQGPEGALRTQPQSVALPAEATELALGRIYGDTRIDIAAAAGSTLAIVQEGEMETRSAPFAIAGLAIAGKLTLLAADGSLHTWDGAAEQFSLRRVAKAPAGASLTAAKVSTGAGQDVVILDRLHHQLHVAVSLTADVVSFDVDNDPVAVLPMRLNSSARQSLVILTEGQTAPAALLAATGTVYTVVNTNRAPTAPGSLGAAINAANANPGQDTIVFNIPGNGPFQIQYCSSGADCGGIPNGPPKITESVILDATTQPGYKGTPIVQFVGEPGQANGVIGLTLFSANAVTVRGLALTGISYGIYAVQGGNHVIEGNYIGTDLSGNSATGLPGDGNAAGVYMENSRNNLIGGTTAAARNVISGNAFTGILAGGTTTNVTVQGNYIGTNALGTAPVGNGNWGVNLGDNSIIGGTTAGAGNVISANGVNGPTGRFSQGATGGVFLQSGNLLQGNYIGTNAAGTAALGNQGTGVFGQAGSVATIGGTTPAARNVISGNTGHGFVENNNPGRVIQGNYIGTAADGVSPLGNGGNGLIVACCATVGGTTAGAGNVIAFNAGTGVLTDQNRDVIRGNSIFSNRALGIDNDNFQNHGDGVNANRNCNPTNFPVLTSAIFSGTTTIAGAVNNDTNSSVDIDLFGNVSCDVSGYGQGHTYLGSTTVTTDSACNANLNLTLPLVNWGEPFVTATATNTNGPHPLNNSTSEFSQCLLAKVPTESPNVGGTQSGNPGDSLPASVRVIDPAGNPIGGIAVIFSVTQGTATLTPATTLTDLNGIATVQVKLGTAAGTVVVSAIANGLSALMSYSVVSGTVPRINAGGVAGAGLSLPAKRTVSPSGIATVFGTNFAPAGTARQVGTGDLVNGNVPTNFAGACVEVGGVRAPVFAVYPNQVNFQAPALSSPVLPVQVIAGCGTPAELRSNSDTITVQANAPEFFFFVARSDGRNPIAAVDALTGAYIGASGLLPSVTTTPAKVNEVVSLFGTSFGATNPPVPPGVFPTGIASVTAPVVVTLGGVTVPQANVLYAGAAPYSPGLFQLNMIVPPGTPDGDLSVVLTIGGVRSPPGAYLTVKSAQ